MSTIEKDTDSGTRAPGYAGYNEPHTDLRDWLERIERTGQIKKIDGADWNLEIGAVAEMIYHNSPENPPCLLFDNIPGYEEGFRVLSGMTNSPKRLAVTLGLPDADKALDVVQAYRDRMKSFAPIPSRKVASGAVLENVDRDDDVDIFKFPVPFLHELDGGRYIGTGDLVIMKDPETDWVNIGTYRVMIHDKKTLGLWMSPGKHGRIIREKYFKQGKPCPVAISVGHDPLLFLAAGNEVNYGVSEFAYAGGHRGMPFDVVESEVHGLPIPANGEIVIEGEIGYYASSVREDPVVHIQRVYWRNDPIITMARPGRPPSDYSLSKCVIKSAMIWDEVESAGLPGVKGVWCHEPGGGRLFNVISIAQAYPGHAKQAAMLAANCHAGNYLGRWVIVVDDDIDPSNLWDVTWAMASRCDPDEDIDVIRKAWSGALDPRKRVGDNFNSRAIVDACRPFDWKDEFPPVAESSPDLKKKTFEKWKDLLD
jgi:4-hydroxy-3-polyprenylbenzoate decarboxylase